MNLGTLLECEIITTQNMSSDEISDLIKKLEITQLANQRLVKGEISFQDYLDCLEATGVNIDEFLDMADDNAHSVGF